jgi:phage terminase large subunit GpA-like protein
MDDHDGADEIERAWSDGLKPDPLLTVSEWADRYRVLSQRASSEPGRWRTDRTPYPPRRRSDQQPRVRALTWNAPS